jgi:hypothetical protein
MAPSVTLKAGTQATRSDRSLGLGMSPRHKRRERCASPRPTQHYPCLSVRARVAHRWQRQWPSRGAAVLFEAWRAASRRGTIRPSSWPAALNGGSPVGLHGGLSLGGLLLLELALPLLGLGDLLPIVFEDAAIAPGLSTGKPAPATGFSKALDPLSTYYPLALVMPRVAGKPAAGAGLEPIGSPRARPRA